MTLKPSCGILVVPGLLALIQLRFSASSGTSTREFFILPNSNTSCPMRPCYTLSQVMDNPSNYFTSNTTVVFPPGHHEVSTEGQLVIQNVNNIALVGGNNDSTEIKCVGQFGLAFIGITNLTVSKLHFSLCGVPIPNALRMFKKMIGSFTFPNILPAPSPVSVYLLNIINLTTNSLTIYHSKGMGLLAVNICGVSSIQQAVFVNNTPNCAIVFLDSYSQTETPVLNITDSLFMLGKESSIAYPSSDLAAGLSIIATQTTYHVKSYIRNITAYGNTGNLYGNILLVINCQVSLQVIQVNSTGGYYYGLFMKLTRETTNNNSTGRFFMLQSYFGRNQAGVFIDSIAYFIKLVNITVENNKKALNVIMNHSSVLIMENVNIIYNMGPLVITLRESSLIEFHGSNTFADNTCTSTDLAYAIYSALHLSQGNVTFYGNTTFLQNKCRYGGAIYAKNALINFQGNVVFLENRAEYGGALMLYQNVSVVTGQFAEVSFVRNHAQKSGGAVYARDSKIVIRTGQKFSFVENEGYNGGAFTLDGGSTIFFEENSSITFVRNHAYHYGGAIYNVDDYINNFEPATELSKCFYGLFSTEVRGMFVDLHDLFMLHHTTIEFDNNVADFAGTAIYGGWVDYCKLYIDNKKTTIPARFISQTLVFDNVFLFHQPTQFSLVSSNPTRVCLCTTKSIPDCSITEYTITTYPGETLTIPAVAVGQRFGTVPSTVHSSFVSGSNGRLPALQHTQSVSVTCTNLMYTTLSLPNRTEVMQLSVEKNNVPQNIINTLNIWQILPVNRALVNLQFSDLTIYILVQFCPLGFVFNNNSQTCVCHPKFQQHEINCSINNQTVYRRSPL